MQDVLILATEDSDIRKLLLAGERIAAAQSRPLRLIGVKPRAALRNNPGEMVEKLFSLAREAHAGLTIYYNDDVAEVATRCVRRYAASRIITNIPSPGGDSDVIAQVHNACPQVPIQFVDERGVLKGYPTMIELARTVCCIA